MIIDSSMVGLKITTPNWHGVFATIIYVGRKRSFVIDAYNQEYTVLNDSDWQLYEEPAPAKKPRKDFVSEGARGVKDYSVILSRFSMIIGLIFFVKKIETRIGIAAMLFSLWVLIMASLLSGCVSLGYHQKQVSEARREEGCLTVVENRKKGESDQ